MEITDVLFSENHTDFNENSVLNVFKKFNIEFIQKQPENYRPAIELYKNEFFNKIEYDWKNWWHYKDEKLGKDNTKEKDWVYRLKQLEPKEQLEVYQEILKNNKLTSPYL